MIRIFDAEDKRKVLRFQARFTALTAWLVIVLVVLGLALLVVAIVLGDAGADVSKLGGLALVGGALLAFLLHWSSRGAR